MVQLSEGAMDLYNQAKLSFPDCCQHIRLIGQSKADEIWAASSLVKDKKTLVVTDIDMMPVWVFITRRLGIEDQYTLSLKPMEGNYDLCITNQKIDTSHFEYIIYLQVRCVSDFICHTSIGNHYNKIIHTLTLDPWGPVVEEEVVLSIRHMIEKSDIEGIIQQLRKARETPDIWGIKFRSKSKHNIQKKDPNCPICYEPYPKQISMMMDCEHVFCTMCLCTWLKEGEGCPLCRQKSQVVHACAMYYNFSADSNPFYSGVQEAIDELVKQYESRSIVVVSQFKSHISEVCKNDPDKFTLYPPSTIMEGMWMALSESCVRDCYMQCIVTDSITVRQMDILGGVLKHRCPRKEFVNMHILDGYPLNAGRVREFITQSESDSESQFETFTIS
jgi:hypothetical protein